MHRNFLRFLFLFLGVALLTLTSVTLSAAQTEEPPQDDPVAYGASLYNAYCMRCHGSYETTVAGESTALEELHDAISGDGRGCQVRWGVLNGGELNSKKIDALVAFITAWQQAGRPPNLSSELQTLPTFTPEPSPTPDDFKPTEIPPPTAMVETNPEILSIINNNPVALGARIYTRRCYRCHLEYSYGRQGLGMDEEKIKRIINEGKAGTSMPAFGWREGGNLKVKEVASVAAYILAWEQLGSEPALPDVLFVAPTPDPLALQMVPLLQVHPVEGRVEEGFTLYSEYCQECHGLEGVGAVAPYLRRDWNSVRADLTIRAGINGGSHPSSFAAEGVSLTEEQVNSLTALIIEWSQDPPLEEETTQEDGANFWMMSLVVVIFLPVGWLWFRRTGR